MGGSFVATCSDASVAYDQSLKSVKSLVSSLLQTV